MNGLLSHSDAMVLTTWNIDMIYTLDLASEINSSLFERYLLVKGVNHVNVPRGEHHSIGVAEKAIQDRDHTFDGRTCSLTCSLCLVSISFPRENDASLQAVAVSLSESCVIQLVTVSFALCQLGTLA